MSLLTPDHAALNQVLRSNNPTLVLCFCAAWCDTCTAYKDKLEQLAQRLTDYAFVWVDIEDYPELLGDEDIENFPTLFIERNGAVQFYGTLLPHIDQLERLLQVTSTGQHQAAQNTLPDIRHALLQHSLRHIG